MDDPLALVGGAIWILGAALGLATLGYVDWRATSQGQPRHLLWQQWPFAPFLHGAAGLFCLGWLVGSRQWYERAGWLLLLGYSLWQGASRVRGARTLTDRVNNTGRERDAHSADEVG